MTDDELTTDITADRTAGVPAGVTAGGPADAPDASEDVGLMLAELDRLTCGELERIYLGRLTGPNGSEEVRLPSRPQSARVARRLVRSVLCSWGLTAPCPEQGELITGELVANAVRHAGGRTIGLRLTRRPGWLRIEVRDSSRALPCLIVSSDLCALNGRGLFLVDTLTERWGVDLLPRGKAVWCEVRLRERAPG